MERTLSPILFIVALIVALLTLLSMSVLLPHERYYRFQAHDNITTRKADWIYERLHFDKTPIDVALIGTSRTAGGLSGPMIEKNYCAATGRRIHVANLAIPVTGRNLHYVIAKEAARAKAPSLTVIELNDVESRRPHPGFIFLADAGDIIGAPITLNLNYFSDLLRLPGRQATLFFQTMTGAAPLRETFEPGAYAGPNLDLTEIVIAVDGRIKSRNVQHSKQEMEALRVIRKGRVRPLHILPGALKTQEYRLARYYFRKITTEVERAGGKIAYAYLPAYGAPVFSDTLAKELKVAAPMFNLGGDAALDATQWLDATHFNADGAAIASQRFAATLAKHYPTLGVHGECH